MPEQRRSDTSSAAREAAEKKPSFRAGAPIRVADVCELLSVSHSTVCEWRFEGTFPEPVKLGPHTVLWRIGDIEGWRDGRRPTTEAV